MADPTGAVGAKDVQHTWLDRGENNIAPKDNSDRKELLKKTDVFTLAAGGFKL